MVNKLCIAIFLISTAVRAGDSCRTDYFTNIDEQQKANEVQEEIDKLPALTLDLSNPKESLKQLIQEIRELLPEFTELVVLEQMLDSGEISPELAQMAVRNYRNKIIKKAEELLQKTQELGLTSKARKILEGYKILLNKTFQLDEKTTNQINEARQKEEDKDKEEDSESSDKDQDSSDEKSQKKESKNQKEKQQKQQSQKNKQKQQGQKKKDQNKSDPNESDSKDDENSQDKSESDKPQTQEEMEELIKELKEQIQKKAEQQKKEQKEKQQKDANKKQDEKQQDGEKDSEQQDDQSQESQKGEKGEEGQEGQEGQDSQEGQSQDGKPSQQKSKGKSKGKSQEGQESSDSSSESSSDGSSQSNSIESGVADKLAKYFKNLLESKKTTDIDGADKELSDEKTQSDDAKDSDVKEGREAESQEAKERREERQRRYDEFMERKKRLLEKQNKENAAKNQNRRAGTEDLFSGLPEMNSLQKSEFIKTYVDQIWAEALRNYTDHAQLMTSLSHFRSIVDSLVGKYPEFSFLNQYSKRALKVYEDLDSAQISYKNLDQLGLSFVGEESGAHVLRKLRFIITVLENIKEVSALSMEEEATLYKAYEVFAEKKTKVRNYEKELGKAFLSQMVGPLSRIDLKKAFPSSDPREDYDWKAMAHAIKSGHLNDLVGFSRVKSYLNMFSRKTFKPRNQKTYSGQKVPINEAEPQLDTADDLDRSPYFHRDGTHPQEDLLRLISGDMLENIYPDQKLRHNPKQKIPKVVTIVVFDVSGSMKGVKDQLRNALIASYLDKTQIDTVTGRAEHVYYFIPFDGAPHAAERVGDFAQAKEYFSRFRNYPSSSGGDTNITDTLVSVYDNIAKHQNEGGELDYANILFITDGEAPLHMDRIEKARSKVNPDVDIILNAITLGSKNKVVDTLVEQNGGKNGTKLGKVFHQHVDDPQIHHLLNHQEKIAHLEKIAEDFDSNTDASFKRDLLFKLKNEITKLAAHREYKDRGDASAGTRLIRELEKTGTASAKAFNFPMGIFLSTMESAVSEGWSLGRRADAFQRYLEKVADIYKIEVNEMISAIDPATKQRLIVWLKKN